MHARMNRPLVKAGSCPRPFFLRNSRYQEASTRHLTACCSAQNPTPHTLREMVKGKGGVGQRCTNSSHKHKKYCKTVLRAGFEERHIDQVWEDMRKPASEVLSAAMGPSGTTSKKLLDEDVPGHGRHYCIPCSRYFQNAVAHADHDKTRPHKRRIKMLAMPARPHNQKDADKAGGLGAADNGRKLRSAAAPAAATPATSAMEVTV